MTVISSVRAPAVTISGLALGLTLTGAALAGNGLLLGTQLFLDARDYSVVAAGELHLAHYVVWTACLVALSQLYPRLGVLTGRSGSTLPSAVLALAGVGAALDACARFVSAFVTPYLAARNPALVDSAPDAVLLVPLLATGVVAMAGTAALGVSAWRRQVFPRPAAALLVLGGVAIPALGPVSNVLLGVALAWIGIAARRRR
jgi:hypothetical protein